MSRQAERNRDGGRGQLRLNRGLALVSVLVSFASVQAHPQGTGRVEIPQVCTVAGLGEHTPADLESVLGATPQGFESLILRHLWPGNTPGAPGCRPLSWDGTGLSSGPESHVPAGLDQGICGFQLGHDSVSRCLLTPAEQAELCRASRLWDSGYLVGSVAAMVGIQSSGRQRRHPYLCV
jgi:hypothetical protein